MKNLLMATAFVGLCAAIGIANAATKTQTGNAPKVKSCVTCPTTNCEPKGAKAAPKATQCAAQAAKKGDCPPTPNCPVCPPCDDCP